MKPTSPFVKSWLPAHVVDAKSAIVDFLKKYYEWSDQNGFVASDIKHLLDNQDINKAPDEFFEFFREEFLASIPQNVLADKKLLLKHILEFYQSRGTERSYKFLFNILFNEDPVLKYPRDTIFMTSAAQWVQDRSVFVFSPSKNLVGIDPTSAFIIDGFRRIPIRVIYAEQMTPFIFEVFFETEKMIPQMFDGVEIDGVFYETRLTVRKFTIKSRGTGFQVGQVYRIPNDVSFTDIRVESVDSSGGIVSASIVRFGFGYNSVPVASVVVPFAEKQATASLVLDTPAGILAEESDSSTDNIGDSGIIVKYDYSDVTYYSDPTYVGQLLGQFVSQTTVDIVGFTPAVLETVPAQYTLYRGYHADIKGFPSDFSRLQDSKAIQDFSYIIESTRNYADYIGPVKRLLHPAGVFVSGERTIQAIHSIDITLTNILAILNVSTEDSVATDDFLIYFMSKALTDSIATAEVFVKNISKPLSDSATVADVVEKLVSKPATDSVTTSETTVFSMQKPVSDSVATSETVEKSISKVASDSVTAPDDGGLALTPFYVGSPSDGNEAQQRYWEYEYLEGERKFIAD